MVEPKKILLVDNEMTERLNLAHAITKLYPNVEIQLIATSMEALFLLINQKFSAVILKVEMPEMSGFELVTEVQKTTCCPPILFLSASNSADKIQKALRLNALDYIVKPVNNTELDRALTKAFEKNDPCVSAEQSSKVSHRLCLLTDSGERFVDVSEILYFQSYKRYAIVFFTDGSHKIVRDNLIHLSQILPKNDFLHLSRQYIANTRYLKYASKANRSITLCYGKSEFELLRIFPWALSELISTHRLRIIPRT